MQNPNSPRDSGPNPAPDTGDLFAANKAINARSMAPAIGLPSVPSYRPSGKMGVLALPLGLVSLLLVPAIGALLYAKLWHFGGLLIFSQLILGALVGALLYPAVQWGKIRNPVLAGVLGALVGAATYFGAMGWEAWEFRPQYIAGESAYIAQKYKLTPAQAVAATEKFYTPLNTIKFYWLDRAQAGMTITSSRSRTSSQISGKAFWFVEAVELILATLLAAIVASQLAARRFSEEFDRWFIAKNLGAIHPLNLQPLLAALDAGDYARAGALMPAKADGQNQGAAQVSLAYLPEKPGGIVTVKAKNQANKGLQAVFERDLSNEQMKAFWPAFPAPNTSTSPFSS